MYDKIISITEIVCCTSYRGIVMHKTINWFGDEFNKDLLFG